MTSKEKIKELKNSIINAEENIKQAKEQIEQLKKENDFEFPKYLKSYEEWIKMINDTGRYLPWRLYGILKFKKQYASLKIQYIADKLNGDWKVDFNDYDQEVWSIYYDIEIKKYQFYSTWNKFIGEIYFKSEELAKKVLEIMGQEMEYLKG